MRRVWSGASRSRLVVARRELAPGLGHHDFVLGAAVWACAASGRSHARSPHSGSSGRAAITTRAAAMTVEDDFAIAIGDHDPLLVVVEYPRGSRASPVPAPSSRSAAPAMSSEISVATTRRALSLFSEMSSPGGISHDAPGRGQGQGRRRSFGAGVGVECFCDVAAVVGCPSNTSCRVFALATQLGVTLSLTS